MNILKTFLAITDDISGYVYQMDTIYHEGQWWLVPEWLVKNDTGQKTPLRLVRPVGGLSADGDPPRAFSANLVPKSALDGIPTFGYVVVDGLALYGIQGPTSTH